MRPDQELHVYGFNWNKDSYFMHKMTSEQQIIQRLLKVRLVAHARWLWTSFSTCSIGKSSVLKPEGRS